MTDLQLAAGAQRNGRPRVRHEAAPAVSEREPASKHDDELVRLRQLRPAHPEAVVSVAPHVLETHPGAVVQGAGDAGIVTMAAPWKTYGTVPFRQDATPWAARTSHRGRRPLERHMKTIETSIEIAAPLEMVWALAHVW